MFGFLPHVGSLYWPYHGTANNFIRKIKKSYSVSAHIFKIEQYCNDVVNNHFLLLTLDCNREKTNQTIVIKTILLCVKIVICKFQNTFRKAKQFESAQRPYAKRWGLTSQLEKFIEIELTIIVLFCFNNHISRVLGFEYFLFI